MQGSGDSLVGFFMISCLLGLAPGPDNLYVLTQSALRGRGAGFAVTLGLCTGLVGHTAAVVLGLAAVLAASPRALFLLRLCGALYLLWLAWHAFRTTVTASGATAGDDLSGWQLYRRGILMNSSNPKVTIFFLAFLPQFVLPDRGPAAVQLALLGGLFIAATLLVFGSIALLAGLLRELFSRVPAVQLTLQRAAGALFIALALKLLLSSP